MTGLVQICILFPLHSYCNDINYIDLVLFRIFGKKIITCNVLLNNLILILNLDDMINKFKYIIFVELHF